MNWHYVALFMLIFLLTLWYAVLHEAEPRIAIVWSLLFAITGVWFYSGMHH